MKSETNEPQNSKVTTPDSFTTRHAELFCITPLSKYLAMFLMLVLPFVGGYMGYVYAPEKVVEVEKTVIQNIVEETQPVEQVTLPEIPEGITGLYAYPTSQDETFPTMDVYFVSDDQTQFIGSTIGCREVVDLDIVGIQEYQSVASLDSETDASIELVSALQCYFAGGGNNFAVVSGLDNEERAVFQQSSDEVIGYGQWSRVLTIDSEGQVNYSWPIEHLQTLQSENVASSVIEEYRNRLITLY